MLLPTVLLISAVALQADLSSGSDVSPEVKKQILDGHNSCRRKVNPEASNMLQMVWDSAAADSAQKWASECQLTTSPIEKRTLNGVPCGENVFMATYAISWPDVIQKWCSGGSNFEYGVGAIDSTKSIYAYTQMVWYNSYKMGCAVAYCPNKNFPYFYVCRYCPAGNIVSQIPTPYKKGPSCGDCPNNCENKLCTNPCGTRDLVTNCAQMMQLFSCKEQVMIEKCAASCNCKTEIK